MRIFGLAALAGIVAAALGVPGPVLAEDAPIAVTLKDHKFDPAEITLPANAAATLMVKNLDASAEEFESKPYKIEKVIAGNGQAVIKLRPMPAGRYEFVGEYHEDVAKGAIIVK